MRRPASCSAQCSMARRSHSDGKTDETRRGESTVDIEQDDGVLDWPVSQCWYYAASCCHLVIACGVVVVVWRTGGVFQC